MITMKAYVIKCVDPSSTNNGKYVVSGYDWSDDISAACIYQDENEARFYSADGEKIVPVEVIVREIKEGG